MIFTIKEYLDFFSKEVDYRSEVVLSLDLYENIKLVGVELIKTYEDEEMIDMLE